MTDPTPYSHVNKLLDDLLAGIQRVLGDKLIGLYLYGSLVTGSYDDGISDVDLLAALASDLNKAEFDALHQMQTGIVSQNPVWDDRIEIAYLSLHGLQTYKTERSALGIISPGEPFHIIDAGIDWLMNWYVVRTQGKTLFGPPPETIIAPVSRQEYIDAVLAYIKTTPSWFDHAHHRSFQSYAILTLCRGLYASKYGEQVSKAQAAAWAQQELPEWSTLIENALHWRKALKDTDVDHEATLPETRRFINDVLERLAQSATRTG